MRNLGRALGAGMFASASTLGATPVFAEERVCRGSIGAVTLDNVRVPPSAQCNLNKTRVKGTIKVQGNAVLVATNVMVIGNIQAEGARNVIVRQGSRIGGSVQVVQGSAATVVESLVNADILYDSNRGRVTTARSRVGGNIQAFQNRGGVGISRNIVDGNLQCKANRPAPQGGRNIVQGNKEDQCARL